MTSTIVQPRPLILASASPRRRELMIERGYEFDVVEPPFDEPDAASPHVPPANHVESLAFFKARSVSKQCPDHIILAADTIAYLNGEIIGKPIDRSDARKILEDMSGTTHEVLTGVALYEPRTGRRRITHDITLLRVRELGGKQIEAYLNTGEWIGKAGAYGIQDEGDKFVERVDGSFTNVVGLPMELIERLFIEWEEGK
ncbi:MAG: septum formation protein Maf [Phycisphaerales bacterium]|nr:septum formation protein Maf [Phycisphaerales bacterium]